MKKLEKWRSAWREAVATSLSDAALEALHDGLVRDDPQLIQGKSMTPYGAGVEGAEVKAGCAICYSGMRGDGVTTVWQMREHFRGVYQNAISKVGQAVWHFLHFWDTTKRDEARRELIPEVMAEMIRRGTNKLRSAG